MTFKELLKKDFIIYDGGMGTMLQKEGLEPGEHPERQNLTHPEIIQKIHRRYYEAGSNNVSTNTFGANILKFPKEELEEIIRAAVENVKAARDTSEGEHE